MKKIISVFLIAGAIGIVSLSALEARADGLIVNGIPNGGPAAGGAATSTPNGTGGQTDSQKLQAIEAQLQLIKARIGQLIDQIRASGLNIRTCDEACKAEGYASGASRFWNPGQTGGCSAAGLTAAPDAGDCALSRSAVGMNFACCCAGRKTSASDTALQDPIEGCPPPTTPQAGEVCAQVVAFAKNPATGECCRYPTPCHAPRGWTIFYSEQECSESSEACEVAGESCCRGDSCNTVSLDCAAGKVAVFTGCDSNCQATAECRDPGQ